MRPGGTSDWLLNLNEEATVTDATSGVGLMAVCVVLVVFGWGLGSLVIALATAEQWMVTVLPLVPSVGITLWLSRGGHA